MEENNNLETFENILPPSKIIGQMRSLRFSKIFSYMALVCCILAILAISSTMILPIIQILLIVATFIVIVCMIVFTFGAIFAVESKPVWTAWKFFLKISDFSGNFENVLNVCLKSVPYFSIIGLVLSGLSILFLLLSKQKKSVGKIVFLSITMAGLAVILILYFVLGGSL